MGWKPVSKKLLGRCVCVCVHCLKKDGDKKLSWSLAWAKKIHVIYIHTCVCVFIYVCVCVCKLPQKGGRQKNCHDPVYFYQRPGMGQTHFIYMRISVFICVCVCMVCLCGCTLYSCVCVCVWLNLNISSILTKGCERGKEMHKLIFLCVYVCVFVRVCVCVYIYICIYIYTY